MTLNNVHGSLFHPHISRRICKRNFSQDHASAVTEQTEDLIFIHIHLIGPTRGNSHMIMPAQLLNRRRISFHPCTSHQTCKRNLKQTDHTSTATEQTEDLVFIHIYLVGPARGTSHSIMPAQLLNRLSISSSSISQEWTPFYIKCLMLTFIWYA